MRKLFSKGKRGLIYFDTYKRKRIVVKVKNPKAKVDRLFLEAEFLQKLNKHKIGPKFLFFKDNELGMEFIDGAFFEEYLVNATKSQVRKVLKEVLFQMRTLDKLGINKREMHRPVKHILIRKNKPVLLDFERCYYTQKPQNVSQFVQYLTSTRLTAKLKEKDIVFDKEKLRKLASSYKSKLTDSAFEKIHPML